jgi:hypothetical protein
LLFIMGRSFTAPLAGNAANRSLQALLKTAEVTQKRNRVVVTARLSPSLFSSLDGVLGTPPETPSGPAASKQ